MTETMTQILHGHHTLLNELIYLTHQALASYHERKTFLLFFIINLQILIYNYTESMQRIIRDHHKNKR